MLKATFSRTLAVHKTSSSHVGFLYPTCVYAHPRRAFATGAPRLELLRSKATNEEATKGTEGMHRDDSASPSVALKHDASQVRGDWVLFHPVYTTEELKSVEVLHREARSWSDKVAEAMMRVMRIGFDIASRYKHKDIPADSKMTVEELRKGGYVMNEKEWLNRILFLETVAGVPGMVAATIRHLRSLRLMRRDSGWIHTLLEEAENERMHLMTFMTLKKPSIFFRGLVLGAQGVYYNLFFLCYLMSPATCHRLVGYLEEEAVLTYTRCIEEIEGGRIPEWSNMSAPEIAKDYWRLSSDATLLDVIYAVRSDESTHRFVNHSLANLDQDKDVNPFAMREPNMHVKGVKPGFERHESEKYVRESHEMMERQQRSA